MFNLFNKKPQEQNIGTATKEYPAIVHKIHKEFLTAGDNIIDEANKILTEATKKSVEKGKRLAALGFKQCGEAVEAIVTETTMVKTAEIAELVGYYKQNYPFNKFITEAAVNTICEKYNLVCGDVSLFTGFVPEINLKQIESFKLLKKEQNVLIASNGLVFDDAEIKISSGRFSHIYKRGKSDYDSAAFQSEDGISFYSSDSRDNFGYKHLGDQRFNIVSTSFQICAPPNQMKMTERHKLIGNKILLVPDPVVLQPVKGGYLIITAWGDEASDPTVVNEINN